MRVGTCSAEKGQVAEDHVHGVHAPRISRLVHITDGLVQRQEEEPNEADEGVVRRIAHRRLVLVVLEDLEGERDAEERGIDDAADPREGPEQLVVAVFLDHALFILHDLRRFHYNSFVILLIKSDKLRGRPI